MDGWRDRQRNRWTGGTMSCKSLRTEDTQQVPGTDRARWKQPRLQVLLGFQQGARWRVTWAITHLGPREKGGGTTARASPPRPWLALFLLPGTPFSTSLPAQLPLSLLRFSLGFCVSKKSPDGPSSPNLAGLDSAPVHKSTATQTTLYRDGLVSQWAVGPWRAETMPGSPLRP